MTQAALMIGSGLVAFGPMLALFALIVYHKAQLVILVTTSAFFYLLAATAASLTWLALDAVGIGGGAVAIIPGVLFQFLLRCAFTGLYHKVEHVIQLSLQKHHEEEQQQQQQNETAATAEPRSPSAASWTDAARLRLQLNDASAAIASAVGFGGMNCVMLYGTLWASETGNLGVLYEDSCPNVPSLAVSAVLSNLFFILQTFWMLLTFFGMRRRQIYHRGELEDGASAVAGWWGNSRHGGNAALWTCLLTHFLASLLTLTNALPNGCAISLPAVGGVVLLTAYLFWAGCGRHYMPPPSRDLLNPQQQRHHWD